MSTPKFTPGPWHIHGYSEVAGEMLVANVYEQPTDAIRRANLAIILAAAEMYEALTEIRAALVEMKMETPFGSPLMHAVLKSNTAIAKAEGRQP